MRTVSCVIILILPCTSLAVSRAVFAVDDLVARSMLVCMFASRTDQTSRVEALQVRELSSCGLVENTTGIYG